MNAISTCSILFILAISIDLQLTCLEEDAMLEDNLEEDSPCKYYNSDDVLYATSNS